MFSCVMRWLYFDNSIIVIVVPGYCIVQSSKENTSQANQNICSTAGVSCFHGQNLQH